MRSGGAGKKNKQKKAQDGTRRKASSGASDAINASRLNLRIQIMTEARFVNEHHQMFGYMKNKFIEKPNTESPWLENALKELAESNKRVNEAVNAAYPLGIPADQSDLMNLHQIFKTAYDKVAAEFELRNIQISEERQKHLDNASKTLKSPKAQEALARARNLLAKNSKPASPVSPAPASPITPEKEKQEMSSSREQPATPNLETQMKTRIESLKKTIDDSQETLASLYKARGSLSSTFDVDAYTKTWSKTIIDVENNLTTTAGMATSILEHPDFEKVPELAKFKVDIERIIERSKALSQEFKQTNDGIMQEAANMQEAAKRVPPPPPGMGGMESVPPVAAANSQQAGINLSDPDDSFDDSFDDSSELDKQPALPSAGMRGAPPPPNDNSDDDSSSNDYFGGDPADVNPAAAGDPASVLAPRVEEEHLDEDYAIANPEALRTAALTAIPDVKKNKIINHVKSRLDHYLLAATKFNADATDLTTSASLDTNPHKANFEALKKQIIPRLHQLEIFEEFLNKSPSDRKKYGEKTSTAKDKMLEALFIIDQQENKPITHISVASQEHKILTRNTNETNEDFSKRVTDQITAYIGKDNKSTAGLSTAELTNAEASQRLSEFAPKQTRITCKTMMIQPEEGAATPHKIVAVQAKSENGRQFSSKFYMQPGFFAAMEASTRDKGFNLPHDGYLELAQTMITDYKKANPNFLNEKKFYIRDEVGQFPEAMVEALMIVAAHQGIKGINQTKHEMKVSQYQIDRYSNRIKPKGNQAKAVLEEKVGKTGIFAANAISAKEAETLIEKTKGPRK